MFHDGGLEQEGVITNDGNKSWSLSHSDFIILPNMIRILRSTSASQCAKSSKQVCIRLDSGSTFEINIPARHQSVNPGRCQLVTCRLSCIQSQGLIETIALSQRLFQKVPKFATRRSVKE
jgi:hypothetical protein